MINPLLGPRKQRTRQHIIADLSVHHVERFILEEGHTVQHLSSDYGYDLVMWTFDEQGYAEPGTIYFQLKAKETLLETSGHYLFDLDIRDYNLWVQEQALVCLVLFDATRKRAYWLAIQQYFTADPARRPKKGAKYIRVQVPKRQIVNRRAIAKIRLLKHTLLHNKAEET